MRFVLILVGLVLTSGCTMGLGDYPVLQCMDPPGVHTIQTVEPLNSDRDVTFSPSGMNLLASFVAPVAGNESCVEAVERSGQIRPAGQDCLFFGSDPSEVPRQPMVTEVGSGHAGVAVKTTSPCTVGALAVRFAVPGTPIDTDLTCGAPSTIAGVALPAITTFDRMNLIVAWFDTSFDSRMDPISSCAGANPAPLYYAIIPSSGATSFPQAVQLAADSTSVRPAAIVFDPPDGRFIIAPAGNSVAVWQLDQNLQVMGKTTVDALTGARAVSAAVTTIDGIHRLAIAAELGCTPQTIAVAIGDTANGFTGLTITPAGSSFAVEPSISWVASRGEFQLSWIAGGSSPRVLVRRIGVDGQLVHDIIDPMQQAVAAATASDGHIISFSATTNSFLDTSLGCDP